MLRVGDVEKLRDEVVRGFTMKSDANAYQAGVMVGEYRMAMRIIAEMEKLDRDESDREKDL